MANVHDESAPLKVSLKRQRKAKPGEENSVAKPDVDCGSVNASAVAPTESPGSSGDMVIDESSETTENVSNKYVI